MTSTWSVSRPRRRSLPKDHAVGSEPQSATWRHGHPRLHPPQMLLLLLETRLHKTGLALLTVPPFLQNQTLRPGAGLRTFKLETDCDRRVTPTGTTHRCIWWSRKRRQSVANEQWRRVKLFPLFSLTRLSDEGGAHAFISFYLFHIETNSYSFYLIFVFC